jgi:hypothetical protein
VPLLRHASHASTPTDVAASFGPLDTIQEVLFRPRGFSPPRRVSPLVKFRACCIPVPEGVRRVSAAPPPREPHTTEVMTGSSRRTRFPATPFAPLEEVPPLAAASHHCDRCPLAVAPLAADPVETGTARATLDLGALLRHRVWYAFKPLPAERALSFHGLRSPPGFQTTSLPTATTRFPVPRLPNIPPTGCPTALPRPTSSSESVRSLPLQPDRRPTEADGAGPQLRTLLGFVTSKTE